MPKTVFKKLPDTTCERIPFEACAPDNCESLLLLLLFCIRKSIHSKKILGKFVPGEAVCHNKTIDIAIDSPEEVCDLQPQKMCKQVHKLENMLDLFISHFFRDKSVESVCILFCSRRLCLFFCPLTKF